ncbi:MAG: class I SAM-dependent methyltransferase [Williamsia sp.]|nr:class I SAM-dependent methyltransferase [Williamsia sp.]
MNEKANDLLDIAGIFRYHNALIEKHGSGSVGALGWLQRKGQQARFEKLSEISDMNGCSVLDAGCGHADLYPFLQKKYPLLTYYGCEQLPQLLNVAAQRYKGANNIRLYLGDFLQASLPASDYIIVSGSLNYRHREEDYIYEAIRTLFAHCQIGLGFNLLSGGTEPGTLLVAYHPHQILRFCQTLTPNVQLHQGYWKDDFTIFMFK